MEPILTEMYLGIDIGGTKISLVTGTKEGKILSVKKWKTFLEDCLQSYNDGEAGIGGGGVDRGGLGRPGVCRAAV